MKARDHLYFIIHKPYRILSQFSPGEMHPGLGSLYDLPKNVYPVGRLDHDSEGLLILTNDKQLTEALLNPTKGHWRKYHVEIDGVPDNQSLEKLSAGIAIRIKGKIHHSLPCKLRRIQNDHIAERDPPVNRVKHPVTSWLEIQLREGKNRQVRKMLAAIGHPVLRLIRTSIEDLEIGEMLPGDITQISRRVIYKKLRISAT
jgi:23S rRNA pseudouridine2457 synthase